jgi:hypothetical protein
MSLILNGKRLFKFIENFEYHFFRIMPINSAMVAKAFYNRCLELPKIANNIVEFTCNYSFFVIKKAFNKSENLYKYLISLNYYLLFDFNYLKLLALLLNKN